MSDPEQKDNAGQPAPSPEQVATDYIEQQLKLARTSLRRTRVVGVIVALIILCYFGYLTYFINSQYLNPQKAADTASQFAGNLVQENGPVLAARLKQEIPVLIQKAPDYVLDQLPKLREEFEVRLEGHFTTYCASSAEELAAHFDTFLEENKDDIAAFLETADQPEGAKALGESLEEELRLYLQDPGEDGESIQGKLDESLKLLVHVNERLEHLVNANELTLQEQKLRHAIAVIMKTVDREVKPIEVPAGTN